MRAPTHLHGFCGIHAWKRIDTPLHIARLRYEIVDKLVAARCKRLRREPLRVAQRRERHGSIHLLMAGLAPAISR